jgi:hypothetical protein
MLIGIGMQVANATKMSKTHELMNGTIRSWFHLDRVRDAINLSMRLAIIYIALSVTMVGALLVCAFFAGMSITTVTTHLFFFGLATLPVGLWGKSAENRVKSLSVQAEDPEIERKFNDYVVQWGQARLQLQDADGGGVASGTSPSNQQRKRA